MLVSGCRLSSVARMSTLNPKPYFLTLGQTLQASYLKALNEGPQKGHKQQHFIGMSYLIGLQYEGIYVGYSSPKFCLCVFEGPSDLVLSCYRM